MKSALLSLAMLLWAALVFAAPADSALQNQIQRAYNQLQSFEADFEQRLTHRESGSVEKRAGRLLFQKPLLIRWQTAKPHEETLVVNEREIWDYLPDEQVAYRYNPALARDSSSIIQVLTGQAKLDRDFNVKAAATEKGLKKLALFPKDPTPQMVEAAIWVEPETGIIRRASVTDFYGNVNDVTFRSFSQNAKIAPGQFSFKAPKGVDIEDRSKDGEKQLFR